jgi:hypothetical protein
VLGETYLGIEIYRYNIYQNQLFFVSYKLALLPFRFYIRCTNCSSEITFKTDPKNADYACEHGASRNFEPWRKEETENEEAKQKRKDEDADSMRALENKTIDNRQEMDILDALDELRSLKARREQMSFDEILSANIPTDDVDDDGLSAADREYITKVFEERRQRICRLSDEKPDEETAKRKREDPEGGRGEEKRKKVKAIPTVLVKSRKLTDVLTDQDKKNDTPTAATNVESSVSEKHSHSEDDVDGPGGLSILQGYGSGSSEE